MLILSGITFLEMIFFADYELCPKDSTFVTRY